MGQKSSVVKVTSEVNVPCECGIVDTIRVSYKRSSCCGPKRRVVASFTFPRNTWRQLFPQDLFANKSAKVAKVNISKLMKKDGDTPVKVNCLAAGVSVFNTEMSLANFLASLQYTQTGGEVLLSFRLKGRRLQGAGAEGHAFTALFINGKWYGDGSVKHHLEPPHHHHADDTNEDDEIPSEDEYSPEAAKKAKEWEEFVANTYNDVWEVEASPEMDPPQGTPDYPEPFDEKLEEDETPTEDEYSPEAEKKAKEWEEFVANTYTDVWEVEVSPEMDPPQGTPDYPEPFDDELEEEETPTARMWRNVRRVVKMTVLGLLAVTALLVVLEPMLPGLEDDEV